MARVFPSQDERVETGAIQFGDDWKGLFIRGDACIAIVGAVNMVRHLAAAEDPSVLAMLRPLFRLQERITTDVHSRP